MENAVRRIHGQMRIVTVFVEHALGETLDMNPNSWHLLVEYGPDIFNMYKLREHGALPYKRLKGREAVLPVASFGENVFYHVAKKLAGDIATVEPPSGEGLFLGCLWVRNVYIIGAPSSAIRTQSIKRRTEDEC